MRLLQRRGRRCLAACRRRADHPLSQRSHRQRGGARAFNGMSRSPCFAGPSGLPRPGDMQRRQCAHQRARERCRGLHLRPRRAGSLARTRRNERCQCCRSRQHVPPVDTKPSSIRGYSRLLCDLLPVCARDVQRASLNVSVQELEAAPTCCRQALRWIWRCARRARFADSPLAKSEECRHSHHNPLFLPPGLGHNPQQSGVILIAPNLRTSFLPLWTTPPCKLP